MLDLKFVRSNLETIQGMLKNRGYDLDISKFETLDRERRNRLADLEGLRHRRNEVSEQIASLKKKWGRCFRADPSNEAGLSGY